MAKGKDALDKFVRRRNFDPQLIIRNNYLNKAVKKLNFIDLDDAYKQISQGGTILSKFAKLLFDQYEDDQKQELRRKQEKEDELLKKAKNVNRNGKKSSSGDAGITVKGTDNLMIHVARCCTPVPGDDIIGFITKGRGISVHRTDCTNIVSLPESERARLIPWEWEEREPGKEYAAEFMLISHDRRGLMAEISRACDEMDVNIEGLNGKTSSDGMLRLELTLSITGTDQIGKITRTLREIPGVENFYRTKS